MARRLRQGTAAAIVLLVSAGPIIAAGQAPADPTLPLAFALPGVGWALELRPPGFVVSRDETRPDGSSRYVYAVNDATDVVMSVRLDRSAPGRTPVGCRAGGWDALRTRSPLRMTDLRTREVGPLAVLEYMVTEYQGLPVGQRHVHAYLGRDDICVEIHLSKVRSTPSDAALFHAIVQTISIRPRATL